ncbi:hypothetical protein [Hydrogenophaga sp. 5NK40-0174]|uniref:hypothetical protein n=1 Tax=Hydrogenophaga sp. 5NK40-0174 TaxID=3127649 RepID=UPI003106DD33
MPTLRLAFMSGLIAASAALVVAPAQAEDMACVMDIVKEAKDGSSEKWRECAQASKGVDAKKLRDACEGFKAMSLQATDRTTTMRYAPRCKSSGVQGICRGAFGSVDRHFYKLNAKNLAKQQGSCSTSGGTWENAK